ncbi:MAG: hypothetical protein ACI89Z_001376 [Porticoccus sp.]|jgi:hypothetical protein
MYKTDEPIVTLVERRANHFGWIAAILRMEDLVHSADAKIDISIKVFDDANPGYLNPQRLIGEYLELHGIASIFLNNKTGTSVTQDEQLDLVWLRSPQTSSTTFSTKVPDRLNR